jgi:hypothetical protein
LTQRRRLAALAAAALLLTACTGGDDEPEATGSTTPALTTTRSSPPSTSAPPTDEENPTDDTPPTDAGFPADTSDDGGSAQSGAQPDPAGKMRVSGLRYSTQQGYVRLVIALNTAGVPEWTARYTEPSGPGGGPIEIDGDAFLRVSLETGGDPGGRGQNQTKVSPGPIAEARTTGFFEGTEEVLIGMRGGEQPFRAFALTDPGRIVIDVKG